MAQYFPTDASVAGDAALQAWAAAMLDPLGGNLGRINEANRLDTRAALHDVLALALYTNLAHNTGNLQDFGVRGFSVAHHPPSVRLSGPPSPTAKYKPQQIMDAMPNAHVYGRETLFTSVFGGSAPVTQFVPGSLDLETGAGAPDWRADLPFPAGGAPGAGPAADAANDAVEALRRAVSGLLGPGGAPTGLGRTLDTNWGWPHMLPRVTWV
jgi:hypothetical protein